MNGAESHETDAPGSQSPSGAAGGAGDAAISTVVDGNDGGEISFGGPAAEDNDLVPTSVTPPSGPPVDGQAVAGQLAAVEGRLAPLEGLADAVAALRQAVRQEFERCAGVLFSHDRVLAELNDRVASIVGRLELVEARTATPAPSSDAPPAPPPTEASPTPELYEQALGHILEQLEGFDRRLQAVDPGEVGARVAGIEERLAALAPLPAVVQALRVTMRADEDLLAAEIASRQGAEGGNGSVPAGALQEMTDRLAAVERRLAPLEAVPDDVAAVSRIVRRELDAVTAGVQAREQVLRRALQKEIERVQGASQDSEEAGREAAQRLELLERRIRGTAQAHDDGLAATTLRLQAIESRLTSVDGLADDIDTLRAAARRELEHLRTATRSHDQSIAETGKRFAALDGRLTRLDALPGEVQSLRSAMRQEVDRTAVTLRSVEERAGELSDKAFRQLRQLAEAVGRTDERLAMIAAELQSARERVQAVEAALAETNKRPDTLAANRPEAGEPPVPAG